MANCIHRHPCRSTPHLRSPPTRKRPSMSSFDFFTMSSNSCLTKLKKASMGPWCILRLCRWHKTSGHKLLSLRKVNAFKNIFAALKPTVNHIGMETSLLTALSSFDSFDHLFCISSECLEMDWLHSIFVSFWIVFWFFCFFYLQTVQSLKCCWSPAQSIGFQPATLIFGVTLPFHVAATQMLDLHVNWGINVSV